MRRTKNRILKELLYGIPAGVIVFLLMFYYIKGSSGLQVEEVVFDNGGDTRCDSLMMNTLIRGYDNIIDVDLAVIGKTVCDDLKPRSVSVRRTPGMKIKISVEEEIPLLWIKSDKLYALSRNGRILNPAEIDREWNLPVLIVSQNTLIEEGKQLRDIDILYAVEFLNSICEIDESSSNRISTIRVDKERGIIITLIPREISVVMGFSEYKLRTIKLKSVIGYLNDVDRMPALVDVRYGDIVQFIYPEANRRVG